ncbi:hypothetical protein EDC04DRAFT_2606928 [Pisolithus marmoratus]|nr:hypothetical protein EDC04DRAFT_2606928 [Pisolithus marmoratus]
MSVDPPRWKLCFSLVSFLSSTASVETQHEELKLHLCCEVMPVLEPPLGEVTKWIQEGLPAAFTASVIDQIVKRLKEDGLYSHEPGSGGAWTRANFYAKEVPKDQGVIQAGNVALLNSLVEMALSIAKAKFPEDPELQQAHMLYKWVAFPNTLIESL